MCHIIPDGPCLYAARRELLRPWFSSARERSAVPAAVYLDINLKYNFESWGGDWSAFPAVNNIFNITPPLDPSTSNNPYRTQAELYDTVGRFFRLGLKFAY